MFKDLNATVTNLVLSMAVVHDLLLTKKYVTDIEIATASARVRSEAKAAMAKLHKASPRGPNGVAH